jgi:hypothetical protein
MPTSHGGTVRVHAWHPDGAGCGPAVDRLGAPCLTGKCRCVLGAGSARPRRGGGGTGGAGLKHWRAVPRSCHIRPSLALSGSSRADARSCHPPAPEGCRRGRLRGAGALPGRHRAPPVAPGPRGAAAGPLGPLVRRARLRGGPLLAGRGGAGQPPQGGADGRGGPGAVHPGGGHPALRGRLRPLADPPGSRGRGARRPARDVDLSALRRDGEGWLDVRARRARHEGRRVRHVLRHGGDPRRRLRPGRRRPPPDRHRGGKHRQRRPGHPPARLPGRRRADPRAHGGTITRAHTGTLWFRLRVQGCRCTWPWRSPAPTPS